MSQQPNPTLRGEMGGNMWVAIAEREHNLERTRKQTWPFARMSAVIVFFTRIYPAYLLDEPVAQFVTDLQILNTVSAGSVFNFRHMISTVALVSFLVLLAIPIVLQIRYKRKRELAEFREKWAQYSIFELKTELGRQAMDTSGSKEDCVARLVQWECGMPPNPHPWSIYKFISCQGSLMNDMDLLDVVNFLCKGCCIYPRSRSIRLAAPANMAMQANNNTNNNRRTQKNNLGQTLNSNMQQGLTAGTPKQAATPVDATKDPVSPMSPRQRSLLGLNPRARSQVYSFGRSTRSRSAGAGARHTTRHMTPTKQVNLNRSGYAMSASTVNGSLNKSTSRARKRSMRHMTPAKSARLNRSAYGRTSDALGLDNSLGLTPSSIKRRRLSARRRTTPGTDQNTSVDNSPFTPRPGSFTPRPAFTPRSGSFTAYTPRSPGRSGRMSGMMSPGSQSGSFSGSLSRFGAQRYPSPAYQRGRSYGLGIQQEPPTRFDSGVKPTPVNKTRDLKSIRKNISREQNWLKINQSLKKLQLEKLLDGTDELYSRNGAIYRWIRNLKRILRSEIITWLKNFDNNTEELTEQPAALRQKNKVQTNKAKAAMDNKIPLANCLPAKLLRYEIEEDKCETLHDVVRRRGSEPLKLQHQTDPLKLENIYTLCKGESSKPLGVLGLFKSQKRLKDGSAPKPAAAAPGPAPAAADPFSFDFGSAAPAPAASSADKHQGINLLQERQDLERYLPPLPKGVGNNGTAAHKRYNIGRMRELVQGSGHQALTKFIWDGGHKSRGRLHGQTPDWKLGFDTDAELVLRVFMAMMEGQHTHDFSKRFYHDESNVITRDLRRKSAVAHGPKREIKIVKFRPTREGALGEKPYYCIKQYINGKQNTTYHMEQGDQNVFFAIVVLLAALHPVIKNEAGSIHAGKIMQRIFGSK